MAADGCMDSIQQLDRPLRPYAPMSEQPSAYPDHDLLAAATDGEGRHEIKHDMIVITSIEGNPAFRPRRDKPLYDVERLVSVEGRDLYRHDVFDRAESLPKRDR